MSRVDTLNTDGDTNIDVSIQGDETACVIQRIYLTRHGRTTAIEAGVFQGWTTTELSVAGRIDAARAAQWWTGRPVAWVVSSPLARAVETSKVLFGRIDELDASFVEVATPSLEGLPTSVTAAYPDLFDTTTRWHAANRPASPLTETRAAVRSRVLAGLARLEGLRVGGDIAVMSHGEILLTVLEHCGVPRVSVPNLAVTELEVYDGLVRVLDLRDPLG